MNSNTENVVVYISGPMSGKPNYNREAFRLEENMVKGFFTDSTVILNPAILPIGMSEAKYMPICLAMLEQADVIWMMEDYKSSAGAIIELEYAKKLHKAICADSGNYYKYWNEDVGKYVRIV